MLKNFPSLSKSILLSLVFVFSTFYIQMSFGKTDINALIPEAKAHHLNPKILQLALNAHAKSNEQLASKHIVTIIDYSLPSTKKRLWIIDLQKNKIIHHTLVAHGRGTGLNKATTFSDTPGSYQSSVGVFKTGATYIGGHGTSLILHGLEKGINGNAFKRKIVIHAADYVSEQVINQVGRLGRSHGCPALSNKEALPIIQKIKNGSLLFSYFPDKNWLENSEFI